MRLKQTLNIAYSNEVTGRANPRIRIPARIALTQPRSITDLEGKKDESLSASPTGAIVHEISHLAGTWCNHEYGDGPVLQRVRQHDFFSTMYAEAYRYYVMNWDKD